MSNTFGLNRSLGAGIATIAIVSVLSRGVVLQALDHLDTATQVRAQSAATIHALDAFRTAMLDQETGLRGYLITGRESSLEPYRAGQPVLEAAIGTLQTLMADAPAQKDRLREAIGAARVWQHDIGDTVIKDMADPATRQAAVAIESSGLGKSRFDALRAKIAAIQGEEDRRAAAQVDLVARAQWRVLEAVWIAGLVTLLICALVALAVHRLIVKPLNALAGVMHRLARRDLDVDVPGTHTRNEIGAMARAVQVFKDGMIELGRTSFLRAAADALPAMLGYVDRQRQVGFLNGEFARWFDFDADDVSKVHGRPLAEAFPGRGFPGIDRELDAAFAGADTRFEHRLARRAGGRRDVEAFYRPHRASDGAVLGVVTLLTDITERKRMERALAQQARDLVRTNEELEQFAYVASHDLKAPLRGIENLVNWIEEDLDGLLTGDVRTNMDLLKNRVRRLESLLDDLLAYSRAGRGTVTPETIDMARLVAEIAALVSPPEGFTVAGLPTLPTLLAPRAPLTQVIQNLIGNAIKHHDRQSDGHVWIAARAVSEAFEFEVADDGPGVPAQFRERVFGMFQTLRPRDEVEGSGMGLAIVKKLVERHGGRIWLEDRPNGRGLAVHFTWPSAKETSDGADR